MKYGWEPNDIRAGRRVQAASAREQWMIGYDASKDGPNNLVLVSLADGMIAAKDYSPAMMAAHLNESANKPVVVEDLVS